MTLKLEGREELGFSPDEVWESLFEENVLRAAIPGCEALERIDETGFAATVQIKIGPVKARFKGRVQITDMHRPHSFRLTGWGEGGMAGFAEGGADVTLTAGDAGGTVMHYTAEAKIGGKLAQLGSRLVQGAATKLVAQFFADFSAAIEARHAPA